MSLTIIFLIIFLKQEEESLLLSDDNDIRSIFTSFMIDWFYPNQKNYDLQNNLKLDKFPKLLEIAEGKIYSFVCLRIIYQYFFETYTIINDCNQINGLCDLKTVLAMKNRSFKIDFLKLIVAHWATEAVPVGYGPMKERIISLLEEDEQHFFELAFLLHENHLDLFDIKLKKYLDEIKDNFGDYHEYKIIDDLPLLLVIINRKQLFKVLYSVHTQCPYLKHNSTIVSMFMKTRDHQRFVVETFDDHYLMVSSFLHKNNEFSQNLSLVLCILQDGSINLSSVKKTLKDFENLSPEQAEIFKTSMFGWKIRNGMYEMNILEQILVQPESEELVSLVWNTFKLWRKGFVLNLVRK